MTSSWTLSKRKEMGDIWDFKRFSHPGQDSLGGWEDSYIINGGCRECSPGYYAIPIGNPYGFQMCVKRLGPAGKPVDIVQNPVDPSKWNGYNRYTADLYRPWRKTQIQMYDPYRYSDRRMPNEAELIRNDMLRLPIKYNGTGVRPIHTPGKPPEKTRYFEYGYSYDDKPPYKYDTTRLIQPYPVWKDTQEYHYSQIYNDDKSDVSSSQYPKLDKIDQTYFNENKGW